MTKTFVLTRSLFTALYIFNLSTSYKYVHFTFVWKLYINQMWARGGLRCLCKINTFLLHSGSFLIYDFCKCLQVSMQSNKVLHLYNHTSQGQNIFSYNSKNKYNTSLNLFNIFGYKKKSQLTLYWLFFL